MSGAPSSCTTQTGESLAAGVHTGETLSPLTACNTPPDPCVKFDASSTSKVSAVFTVDSPMELLAFDIEEPDYVELEQVFGPNEGTHFATVVVNGGTYRLTAATNRLLIPFAGRFRLRLEGELGAVTVACNPSDCCFAGLYPVHAPPPEAPEPMTGEEIAAALAFVNCEGAALTPGSALATCADVNAAEYAAVAGDADTLSAANAYTDAAALRFNDCEGVALPPSAALATCGSLDEVAARTASATNHSAPASLASSDTVIVLGTGQSGMSGAYTTPISTSAAYPGKVVTFNGGVKANADTPLTDMGSIADLVENADSAFLQTGGTVASGETCMTTLCNGFLERTSRATGARMSELPRVFGTISPAVAGSAILPLMAVGPALDQWYERMTTTIQRAHTLLGGGSFVGFVAMNQGEADQGSTPTAAYRASLRAYYNQICATVAATTGQLKNPPLLLTQKSYGTGYSPLLPHGAPNTHYNSVTIAQSEEEGDGIYVAYPDYCIPFLADTIHPNSPGQVISGHYFARAASKIIGQRLDWRGLQMKSAWSVGSSLYVEMGQPVGPLVIDTSMGVVNQSGFRVDDDTGTPAITAVSVYSPKVLKLTMARALTSPNRITAPPFLRYALSEEMPGNLAGCGGNIRDSDTETVNIQGTDYQLANWLQAGTVAVAITGT